MRHRSSSVSTAWGSTSGTSSSAGASIGTPPRRVTNSARWAPVRVSKIATTLDFMRKPFNHHNADMSIWLKSRRALVMALIAVLFAPLIVAQTPDKDPVRDEFVAAMQRIRLHQPDIPDSA